MDNLMTERRPTTPLTPELLCSDIKVSLSFYTEILGFKIEYHRLEDGFAMLERQGSRIMLDEIVPGSERSWIAAPLEAPFGRGINLQIETDSIDIFYASARKAAAKIFLPIEDKWYRAKEVELGQRQFIVQDPDGYLLRFFEYLGEREAVS
jgi:catechol 2,3-dioxygenase-like lactoylglutathione lyase family enzyme